MADSGSPKAVEAPSAIEAWQRLSPIAILYFVANTVKQSISGFVYLLPGLAVGYNHFKEKPVALIGVVVLFLGLASVSAVLHFVFYHYRLSGQRVEVKSGVMVKKHLDLPFSRIQNVTLVQPFYYRPFGYVSLELDTAGSSSQEARVVALPKPLAKSLKEQILKQYATSESEQVSAGISEAHTEPQPNQERVLNRRSIMDLVIHGITNNRVWIILGAMAPLYDNMGSGVNQWLQQHGIDLAEYFSVESLAWWQLGAYTLTLILMVMTMVALLSVIGSVVIFYGYTLSKTQGRYIRRSGLFTRQEVSMKLSRLQMVVRKQDWLDGLLGRINLHLEQNKTRHYDNSSVSNQHVIVVPSVTPAQATALIDDAFPENTLSRVHFTPISRRFIVRFCLLLAPVWGVFLILGLSHQNVTLSVSSVAFGIMWSTLVVLRWYRWGVASDDNFHYVRRGLFGVDYLCLPIDKVQQTSLLQSVFMERRGLASVRFVLASEGVLVPFLPESLARNLIEGTLFIVESRKRPWM